jgi:hypothetical protein
MDVESTFMQQFSGSASANLAFGALFMLYMGIKKLCARKSKCKSHFHTCCLDVDVEDESESDTEKRKEGEIHLAVVSGRSAS